jgi:predicted TIM-barrel fold metal-dependent hydrolase
MNYSRREFIRQNSLALLGAATVMGSSSFLFDESNSSAQQEKNTLFFDAFTRIGPRRFKHPGEQWSLQDMIREIDHCSISGAMVASTLSLQYDAMYSNLELSQMIKPYPNLFAIWNVIPNVTNEFPNPKDLKTRMDEHNVRAVTINPFTNTWNWSEQSSKEILEFLNTNKILTITTSTEMGGWERLDQFLSTYRSIPVLLIGAGWDEQRYVFPLLKAHSNLHISFDHFQINEGIEDLYRRGFINQLVFASDTPTMSAGAHRTYVDYAEIPEDARAKVAGGNLIRLLGGLRPPVVRTNKDEDILMTSVRQGRPLPVPVVDMHMHMLHEGLNGTGNHYHMENGGPKGIFDRMKKIGCIGGGFMSWNGVVSGDFVGGNKLVKDTLNVSPRGFWGLATFSPTYYPQQELAAMISQVYSDKRIIGMKPYPLYGVEYHHPSYTIWWEYGAKNDLYALLHPSRTDLLEIETLAQRYPNVRWVSAHAGGSYAMADMVISAMKKYNNIFAEITLTPVPMGIIEYMVERVGDDRIVYGSDLPMRDPRQQLGWVVFSKLPLATKKKILGENARRVVQPCIKNMPEYNVPAVYLK